MKPCDAAASRRAAFAACISSMSPPSSVGRLLGGASVDGIDDIWPVSEMRLGSIVW